MGSDKILSTEFEDLGQMLDNTFKEGFDREYISEQVPDRILTKERFDKYVLGEEYTVNTPIFQIEEQKYETMEKLSDRTLKFSVRAAVGGAEEEIGKILDRTDNLALEKKSKLMFYLNHTIGKDLGGIDMLRAVVNMYENSGNNISYSKMLSIAADAVKLYEGGKSPENLMSEGNNKKKKRRYSLEEEKSNKISGQLRELYDTVGKKTNGDYTHFSEFVKEHGAMRFLKPFGSSMGEPKFKIGLGSSPVLPLNIRTKNKYKIYQFIAEACMSPATGENEPGDKGITLKSLQVLKHYI